MAREKATTGSAQYWQGLSLVSPTLVSEPASGQPASRVCWNQVVLDTRHQGKGNFRQAGASTMESQKQKCEKSGSSSKLNHGRFTQLEERLTEERSREDTARRWPSTSQKRALTRNQPNQHLDLGPSAFRTVRKINFCCLSHQVYGILLWQP